MGAKENLALPYFERKMTFRFKHYATNTRRFCILNGQLIQRFPIIQFRAIIKLSSDN